MRNRFFPVALAGTSVLAALALTGCTTISADSCVPVQTGGALVNNVSVSTGFGEEPSVMIPEDITNSGAQSITVDRTNPTAKNVTGDAIATISYALYESENGEAFESVGLFANESNETFVPVAQTAEQGSFLDALKCALPGDRVVVAFDPAEAAVIGQSLLLEEGTNVVGVIDVHDVVPLKLTGKVKNLPSGFPGVVTNSSAEPGVILVPGAAPEKTLSAVRIAGAGKPVTADHDVVANILQVSWDGVISENTWLAGGPINIGTTQNGHPVRALINDFRVGSQVVVIQPTDTNADIFVIDVLAAG